MNENDKAALESPRRKRFAHQEKLPGIVTFIGIAVAAGIVLLFALAGCVATPDSNSSSGAAGEAPAGAEKQPPSRPGEIKLGHRTVRLRLSAAEYAQDCAQVNVQ